MSRMANSTIEELSYADMFYYKWVTEHNVNDLHRLTAILYRQKAKNKSPEDSREPFSNLLLEKNALLTDEIPLHIKFMVAHSYQGCRADFIKRYKNVFPQPPKKEIEEESNIEKATEKKKKIYHPFSKIINAMAMGEVQIFGTHQEAEKVLAPKFLSVYDADIVLQREKARQRELNKK